eukprot:tig00021099_g18215.t1
MGQYAAARRTCGELIHISKHLGIDGRVIQVVALVDASTALLEGRPARAERLLHFVEPLNDFIQQQEWWYLRSLDVFRGICAWRAGDAAGAAASFEGAFECWRGEAKTATWPALLFISVLLDFALWYRWQSDTAVTLAAALDANRPKIRLGAVARLRALACGGSPRASVSDCELEAGRACARNPATPAPLTARAVLLDTVRPPPRASFPKGRADGPAGAGDRDQGGASSSKSVRIVSDLDAGEADGEPASDRDRGVDALALLLRVRARARRSRGWLGPDARGRTGGGRAARDRADAPRGRAGAGVAPRQPLVARALLLVAPLDPGPPPRALPGAGRLSLLRLRRAPTAGDDDDAVRALAAEAKQAAAFLRDLGSLLEETCRQRLPNLAPCCDLLRAQRPGAPRARRLASLRAARDGFAAGGLRPLEALACMQLARAEPDRAAAAAALDAAGRIADETRTVIPALERLRGARAAAAAGAEAASAPTQPSPDREGYLPLFA